VDDHRHVGDRGGEPAATDELTGHPPDCRRGAGGAGSAAEHPDLVIGGQEPRDHAAAEGAAVAGDQDRLVHGQDLPVRKLDTGRRWSVTRPAPPTATTTSHRAVLVIGVSIWLVRTGLKLLSPLAGRAVGSVEPA
jgi:hypothetical protein